MGTVRDRLRKAIHYFKRRHIASLSDYSQIVKVMIGGDAHEVNLVPDTRLNDVTIITDTCENCSTGGEKWKPPGGTPKVQHATELTYIKNMRMHEVELKGSHYREMACFEDVDICGSGIY